MDVYVFQILCLQEVNCEHHRDFFTPELQALGLYTLTKTDNATPGVLDCA